ncbi:extracellular solute-binding protein [Ornithinimicrobium sp. Y1847]|uniref:extracellular solute-binding protein n=1 Tax=Ornithinimicrobium sp. Y1847 TaxID=3405419 RepID=UPI003B675CBA
MKKTHLTRLVALAAAGTLTLTACGGDGFDDETTPADNGAEQDAGGGTDGDDATGAAGGSSLKMLIASSGDAETNAVQEAVDAWGEESGNTVEVTVASDMNQELAQGFAGGSPADVFYLNADAVATNAEAGNLFAYTTEDNDDFYEALRNSFVVDGEQYCAPKDFSTLALVINTGMWEEAGLTDDDIPTTYDELADVAQQLTTDDHVGLAFSPEIHRVGAFVVGSGGWWMNDDQTEPTANTPEVIEGLEFVQSMLQDGSAAYATDLGTGWGGEAFGTEAAAMTIEGNWIKGAMENDYPDVDYTVVEMPEGSGGPGTLTFTQCWGIAADSSNQDAAVDLVTFLTSPEQQMKFADAFGVMPSRQSAAEDYASTYPEDEAFIAGGEYARGPVNVAGSTEVIADLNSQLEGLANGNVQSIVESFDNNMQAVLDQ